MDDAGQQRRRQLRNTHRGYGKMTGDAPLFEDRDPKTSIAGAEPHIGSRIRKLIDSQPYGVLCVQGEGQPYGALVAFAFSDDLRRAVFATPMATRKFRLLVECDRVALLIDNRADRDADLMRMEAVTATGRSAMLERGAGHERWARVLAARHPHLEAFTRAQSSALFVVNIVRFFHVTRFQEVKQWVPGPS